MVQVFIIAVAVLPPLFLAAFFLTHFRHRFGLSLGVKALIGGMISAPLALGFSLLLARLGLPVEGIAGAAVRAWMGAAIPEEIAKFLIVWFYIRRHPDCDSAGDLFCGSVLVGLGFALLENILYVTGAGPDWFSASLLRGVMAVPGHTIDGMVMGVFLAWWWRKAIAAPLAVTLALVLPIAAHGLYDFPLMALKVAGSTHEGTASLLQIQLLTLFVLVLAVSAAAAWWSARAELIEVFRRPQPDIDLHRGDDRTLRFWRWIGWAMMLGGGGVLLIGLALVINRDIEGAWMMAMAILPAAFGAILSMRLPEHGETPPHNWPRAPRR